MVLVLSQREPTIHRIFMVTNMLYYVSRPRLRLQDKYSSYVSLPPHPSLSESQPSSSEGAPGSNKKTVLQQELQTKDQQLQDSQSQIKELKRQVEQKNEQLQMIEKDLLQHEQIIGELRVVNDQLKRQLQQAQQQVKDEQYVTEETGAREVRELIEQLQPMKQPRPPPPKTVMHQKLIQDMRWQKESKVPDKLWRGSAAADSNMAYFNGYYSTTVHSFNANTLEWHQLPATPHIHFTLVVVHHILTMVGGSISGAATDSLLSLMGEGRDIKWLPNLPAMPTKRYWTAVVCSGCSLIVAGGKDGHNRLATVEVLDTDTRQWSIASSLTHPFSEATMSFCGERLYMLGGDDQTGRTCSVLSCSVPELLQSCQPQPLAGKLQTVPAKQSTIWRRVADALHYLSSCASLGGQLVAVGGEKAFKNTSVITGYNEATDSWEAMDDMPTARNSALVAILNGKMMVVGGVVGGLLGTETDIVEVLC